MENKKPLAYLFLGLGLGIIISNLMNTIYPQKETVSLSDQEVVLRAEELGMTWIKDKIVREDESTREDSKKSVEEAVEEVPEIEETIEEEKESEPDLIDLYIDKGLNSREISELILESGLIDNKDEFENFVKKQGKDKLIIYGRYKIPKGSSFDEILNILTSPRD